ncbi:MAG: FxsA cytoplasmic rane protein [Marmoricola sp.]|nr:FxsA cytoplasmic rane protein [Marmoricola sp.]
MRRSFPWWLLLVAFILVPIAEIYVLIKVGQVIGVWWTVLLLIADSAFGSWLIRHQGSRAWRALRVALSEGRMPARELADGILIVIGGTLMISPGFVTDAFGMVLILPFTRPLGRRFLARALTRRLGPVGGQSWNVRRPGPPGDVVQGDVVQPDGGQPGDPG